MFATVTGWTEIAQKINELFEKEVKRNSNRLLFLNKQPAFVNYGPYYEIQAGGICYANQDKDEGTIHSDMGNQVHEEEPCEEGDDEEEVEEAPSDEELVTKLKSIFYNNAEEVRRFLKEIHGMTPSDVTDLVNRWVKDKRISDYGNSRKGVLWSILHEAGLYPKSKTNWNRRVG